MPKLSLFSRTATTFSKEGGIDEDALRQFLQRFVDAKVGVYLASAGSGEGNALTEDELRCVYRIGVEVCKGKIPVNGNPPERQTVAEALRQIMLAVEAGVEIVNIYGPPGWHAYWPTDDEYLAFFDKLLPAVKHPVALAPYTASARGSVGYSPRPALVADICRRYHQIVAVNLTTHDDDYFIELKDSLDRDVDIFVPLAGSMNTLMLGAAGLNGGEFNITPKTFRQYLDLYESGKFDEAALVYADLKRFTRYVSKWRGAHPRWIKMAMKVLKLPGGEGGVRGPYLMPGEDELRKFTDGLLRLRIPEIDDLARAAGLVIPT